MAGELVMGEQAVERTFQVAAVMGDGLGDIGQHRQRHVEARMVRSRRHHPRFEDFEAQFLAEAAHFDHQAAGKPRADAVVEAFQFGRRSVGGDHHLAAAIDQRVEGVAELGLGRFALQELQIVDHQHADAA